MNKTDDTVLPFVILFVAIFISYFVGWIRGWNTGIYDDRNGNIVWHTNSVGRVAFTLAE